MSESPNKDIRAIIVMLATQGLINLGEVRDPIKHEFHFNLEGGAIFKDLLGVLKDKTAGNLTPDEEEFLDRAMTNINALYEQKKKSGK